MDPVRTEKDKQDIKEQKIINNMINLLNGCGDNNNFFIHYIQDKENIKFIYVVMMTLPELDSNGGYIRDMEHDGEILITYHKLFKTYKTKYTHFKPVKHLRKTFKKLLFELIEIISTPETTPEPVEIKTNEHFIIKTSDELAEMKKGRDIKKFSAVFIDGIGYYEYGSDTEQ